MGETYSFFLSLFIVYSPKNVIQSANKTMIIATMLVMAKRIRPIFFLRLR